MPIRPFLFCRYAIFVGEEELRGTAQSKLLAELQGQPVAHGEKAAEEKNYDTLLMRPKHMKVEGHDVHFWSVGVMVKERLRATYDKAKDQIDLETVKDGSIRYNDFIAVPSIKAMAVDDRGGRMKMLTRS